MVELFDRPEQIEVWRAAAGGQLPDWDELLAGYAAAVDYPASAFWPELSEVYPDSVVVLSVRSTPEQWWDSANATIYELARRTRDAPDSMPARLQAMAIEVAEARLTRDWNDKASAMAAYERHNQTVRDSIEPDRFVEWEPGDGWGPICAALNHPIPDEPFPHTNTTGDFRAKTGLD